MTLPISPNTADSISKGQLKLASGLAASAMLSSENEEAAIERISPFLDALYTLDSESQSDVITQALEMIDGAGDDFGEGWLLDEAEFQAQTRDVSSAGVALSAIIFAVPVLLTGDIVPSRLLERETMEMAEILTDCEIVNSASSVQLVPALYTVDELLSLSWGDVAGTCENAARAGAGSDALSWAPPSTSGANDGQSVRLRFVLGVLVTAARDADDAFPPLDLDEDVDADDEKYNKAFGFTRSGFNSEGTPWEELFAECLERATGHESIVVSTGAPEGFYFDILAGLNEWRSAVFRSGMDAELERMDLVPEQLCFEIQPGARPEEGATLTLVHLYKSGAEDSCLLLEWFTLPEEPDFVAQEELLDLLEALKIEPKLKFSSQGMYQLH